MNRLKTQEIIVAIIAALSVFYVIFRIVKKARNHDCDNCNH